MGTEQYYLDNGEYQKVYNLAIKGEGGEKENAISILRKHGLYVDKAGLIWSEEEMKSFRKENIEYMFGENYFWHKL